MEESEKTDGEVRHCPYRAPTAVRTCCSNSGLHHDQIDGSTSSSEMAPSSASAIYFRPPLGLKENENVLWSRRSGPFLGGSNLGRAFLAFGLMFFVVGLFPSVGSCYATMTWCNWFVALSIGPGLILSIIGGLVIWQNMGGRGEVQYFLTNYRIVETRSGRVVGQVPTNLFRGVHPVRYLAKESSYEMEGRTIYNVSVHDPESGRTLMRLTDMSKESVDALAMIGTAR